MSLCLFVSDLHGSMERYRKLFALISTRKPELVFLGGDLLPFAGIWQQPGGNPGDDLPGHFLSGFLLPRLAELKNALGNEYPRVLAILGNDDPRREERVLEEGERLGLLHYLHNRRISYTGFSFYGYSCVPPTPFLLKDWECYDVSRFTDAGAVPPGEGWRSVALPKAEVEGQTIQADLRRLSGEDDLSRSVFLFHAPPYRSKLDRAALNGKMIDGAPLDVHVGSIAVRRFIEQRAPFLTLHGHVHESARLTGSWRELIGSTYCFTAAHDGPELAVVEFLLEQPEGAKRFLV